MLRVMTAIRILVANTRAATSNSSHRRDGSTKGNSSNGRSGFSSSSTSNTSSSSRSILSKIMETRMKPVNRIDLKKKY